MLIVLYLVCVGLAFLVLISQLELTWFVIVSVVGLAVAATLGGFPIDLTLSLAILLILLLLGRLVYLGATEFSGITQKLGKKKTARLLLKTVWRWLPLFLFALIIVAAMIWRNAYVQELIYAVEDTSQYACENENENTGMHLICKETDSFENDLHAFVQRFGNTFSNTLQKDISKAVDHIENTSGDLEKDLPILLFQGQKGFNSSQPIYPARLPDSLQPPRCPWFLGYVREPANCLKRDLFSPLNKGYANIRQDTRRALEKKLRSMDASTKNSSSAIKKFALQEIKQSNEVYQQTSHKTLDLIFLKGRVSSLIFYAFVFFLLLKIFLYVFTRFAFDAKHGGVSLSLKPLALSSQDSQFFQPRKKTNAMQVEELGNEVSLDLGDDTWYATKHRKVRYAQKGKPAFPMPLRLLFRRLTTGSYYLYRCGKADDCPRLEPYADDVTHFIKVTLADEDQLCISLKNLVAFTQSIQLKSLFSPKFSVFFKHSLFFTVMKGPGQVVLRVDGGKGKVIIGKKVNIINEKNDPLYDEKKASHFFNPVDLIAFDVKGSYDLAAQHDIISVYTEGHTIRPRVNSLAIRQVHDEKGTRSILSGFRKLLLFLLPI